MEGGGETEREHWVGMRHDGLGLLQRMRQGCSGFIKPYGKRPCLKAYGQGHYLAVISPLGGGLVNFKIADNGPVSEKNVKGHGRQVNAILQKYLSGHPKIDDTGIQL